MPEPLKKSTLTAPDAPTSDPAAPRTARARSERDLGRNKRPARGERPAKRSSSRSEPRTAPERPRSDRNRQSRGGSDSPRRPRDVKAGSGARILAPLALIVFAIACFAVVTNQSGNGSVGDNAADTSSTTTAKKAAAAGAAASTPTRATYKVKAGDSFAAIAEKEGVDVNTLQELNPDIDPRALQPGQKLKLR